MNLFVVCSCYFLLTMKVVFPKFCGKKLKFHLLLCIQDNETRNKDISADVATLQKNKTSRIQIKTYKMLSLRLGVQEVC